MEIANITIGNNNSSVSEGLGLLFAIVCYCWSDRFDLTQIAEWNARGEWSLFWGGLIRGREWSWMDLESGVGGLYRVSL